MGVDITLCCEFCFLGNHMDREKFVIKMESIFETLANVGFSKQINTKLIYSKL